MRGYVVRSGGGESRTSFRPSTRQGGRDTPRSFRIKEEGPAPFQRGWPQHGEWDRLCPGQLRQPAGWRRGACSKAVSRSMARCRGGPCGKGKAAEDPDALERHWPPQPRGPQSSLTKAHCRQARRTRQVHSHTSHTPPECSGTTRAMSCVRDSADWEVRKVLTVRSLCLWCGLQQHGILLTEILPD